VQVHQLGMYDTQEQAGHTVVLDTMLY
jgi:hypothetical protein